MCAKYDHFYNRKTLKSHCVRSPRIGYQGFKRRTLVFRKNIRNSMRESLQ